MLGGLMRRRNFRIYVFFVTIFSIFSLGLLSKSVYAEGWIGTGNLGGGGGSSTGGGTSTNIQSWCSSLSASARASQVNCLGMSWVYYSYVGNANTNGKEVYFTPMPNSSAKISSECAKSGSGFWHYGRNTTSQTFSSYGYFGDYNYTTFCEGGAYCTKSYNNSQYGTSGSSWGHLETYSVGKAESTYGNQAFATPSGTLYNSSMPGTLNHSLYLNGVEMYRATEVAGSHAEVLSDYKAAYHALNNKDYTGTSLPNDLWGFCYSESMDDTPGMVKAAFQVSSKSATATKTSGGNGATATFSVTGEFTIKRKSNGAYSHSGGAITVYSFNGETNSSKMTSTNKLKKEKTQDVTSTKTVSVAVGASQDVCFDLKMYQQSWYASSQVTTPSEYKKIKTWTVCTTVSNPKPANKTATFTGDISITGGNGLTCSQKSDGNYTCEGNGEKESGFSLVRTFTVSRSDTDTSLNGVAGTTMLIGSDTVPISKVTYSTAASGGYCPVASFKKSGTGRCIIDTGNSVSVKGSSGVKKSDDVELSSGEAGSLKIKYGSTGTFCFSLIYSGSSIYEYPFGIANRVGGTWGNGLGTGVDVQRCVTVSNPKKVTTTFSGSVAGVLDSRLYHVPNSNTYLGDGHNTSYTVDRGYSVKRTDNNSEISTSSSKTIPCRYSPNTCTGVVDTDNLAPGATWTRTYSDNNTVAVAIGTTGVQLCLSLKYDTYVIYRGGVERSRDNMSGSTSKCYTFKNPSPYIGTYSATTSGYLLAHDKLTLSNSNKTGKIENQARDSDNERVFSYPSDSVYKGHFTHVLSRTNTSDAAADSYFSNTTYSTYQVQQQVDGGAWTNVGSASGTKTFESRTDSFTVYDSDVNLATMNASNAGKYLTVCQRLYFAATSETPRNGNASNTSYTYSTSSPTCLILKNPDYRETETPNWDNDDTSNTTNETMKAVRAHVTRVIPFAPTVHFMDGAVKTSSGTYQVHKYTLSALYDHLLKRQDYVNLTDKNKLISFDESLNGTNYDNAAATETMTGGKFVYSTKNGSMYENDAFEVTSGYLSQQKFYELGTSSFVTGTLYPISDTNTNTRYNLTFGANSVTSPDPSKWDTSTHTNNNGRTLSSLGSSIPAGVTATLMRNTNVDKYQWRVRYVDVLRREVYYSNMETKAINEAVSGGWMYDRTKLVSTSPELVTGEHSSEDSSVRIERKRNYEISSTSINAPGRVVVSAAQTISPTFHIDILKDTGYTDKDVDGNAIRREYITDMNSEVKVIKFVVGNGVTSGSTTDSYLNDKVDSGDANAVCGSLTGSGFASSCDWYDLSTSFSSESSNSARLKGTGVYRDDDNNGYTIDLTLNPITVPTSTLGDKFCIALVISNRSSTSSQYYKSTSYCVGIGKRPNVQVYGGSVGSSGNISTAVTAMEAGRFGSWTDLAVIADGIINNMSSGNGIVAKKTSSDSIPCGVSSLTIANKDCSTNGLGNSDISLDDSTIDNLIARYENSSRIISYSTENSIEINADTFSSFGMGDIKNVGYNVATSDVTALPFFIHSSGTVTIADDIVNYFYGQGVVITGNAIPQVIIVADQGINIAENVSRVDAWLLTRGTIDTCTKDRSSVEYNIGGSDNNSNLNSDQCGGATLRINGAMIAKVFNLKRTYGADYAFGNENMAAGAELIDLNPSMYLFGTSEANQSAQPKTTYLKKLAPRY